MTTNSDDKDAPTEASLSRMAENLKKVESLSERLSRVMTNYFEGDLSIIESIPTATAGTPFQREVWQALRTIPCGQVMHYGQLAEQLGRPGAARAVGAANGSNPVSVVVPCHRVIGRNGTMTGYAGGVQRKEWLLRHEGYLLL